jgi:hypothetical protein
MSTSLGASGGGLRIMWGRDADGDLDREYRPQASSHLVGPSSKDSSGARAPFGDGDTDVFPSLSKVKVDRGMIG